MPDRIVARLEREGGEPTFWERVVDGFSFRPAFAYSFAFAAFGALTFSVISIVRTQPQDYAQTPPGNGWRSGAPSEALASQFNSSFEPLHVANWVANTNPSATDPELPSLFGNAHNRTLPVSYASP